MIVKSCVRVSGNKYYLGKRHGDCFEQITDMGMDIFLNDQVVCGFVTDELKFLNRRDAYYHAFECGQCKEQKPGKQYMVSFGEELGNIDIKQEKWKPFLASEDLW
jgi:hypothetical protein